MKVRPPSLVARGLLAAGLFIASAAHAGNAPAAAPSPAASAPTARPAVGLPLVQAEALVKDGRFAEALVKVGEAEKAATDASAYERYILGRSKAAAALGTGQTELAFNAIEAAIETRHLEGDAQRRLIESLVHAAYGAKDYARAARWAARHAQEAGPQADMARLRTQAQYLSGDVAGAAAALQAQMKADEQAGRPASERDLQWLATAQRKLQDQAGLAQTMERLATRYPQPAYWSELLARVDRGTLSERLFLDFMRLARATGNLSDADQHVALANLALSAGYAGEAVAVLEEGQAKKLLDPAKHRALHDKARKLATEDRAERRRDEASARSARDGNGLVFIGQSTAAEGQLDAGIALMEQGLAKGGVRRAGEAQLRLGEAQALAGRSAAATQTLSAVKGPGGLGELAQLWSLYAVRARPAPAVAVAP